MTPISIFLIWPDSILNKLDPLSYTAVHKSELWDDLVWTPHTTQTQITLMYFPMEGESLLAGWGMVRKRNFISCFQISFQPLLDPVSLTSFSLYHTLSFAGPPARLAILQGRTPPWVFSTMKPSGHGVHLPSSSSLTVLWDGMQNGGALEILEASLSLTFGLLGPAEPYSWGHHIE